MNTNELDIIIPVPFPKNSKNGETIAENIIYRHKKYGFKKFALCCPAKGWRSLGFPSREHYIECAEVFRDAKRIIEPYNLELGWYMCLTLKSGASDLFTSPIKSNGEKHRFSSCPLDSNFKNVFSENVALFAKIAEPDFIFTEDDFSIRALNGCFCELHLKEFANREGREYTREELLGIFSEKTPESYALMKRWRALSKDSLVDFAKCIRKELDKESSHIPVGYMQSGGADDDGDVTNEITRALAGDNHQPQTRLYGTFYCGAEARTIPQTLYHPLYSKQHLGDDIKFYHESDAYPHSRFYSSGAHMRSIMSTAFSYGFDGSIYFLGKMDMGYDEEPTYGKMFSRERKRFNEVHRIAKMCNLKGVEVDYDPFWNTADNSCSTSLPLWADCLGSFGIPVTTIDSEIAFWDVRQSKYADHETIMKKLSKVLVLDGDGAKALCERGYGKYMGVEIGEDIVAGTDLMFDLSSTERICDEFADPSKGNSIPCAHSYCPHGSGKWLEITKTDEKCRVVTEAYTFLGKLITPAMTIFENDLGGKVIVMSLTLDGNKSHALFHHRRQRLIQNLISLCSDEFVYVKDDPEMFLIVNEPKDKNADFVGMLTLTNLCEDSLDKVTLHLPRNWKGANSFLRLNQSGEWEKVKYTISGDSMEIHCDFKICEPVYILGK